MSTFSRLIALAACAVAGACGSTVATMPPVPHAAGARYFGSSPSDIWSAEPVSHWNGSTWTDPPLPPGVHPGVAYAGPGKIWVSGIHSLWRVDVHGTVEDFSAELVAFIGPNHTTWSPSFFVGNGRSLVVVNAINSDQVTHAFLFDGAHLREIPLPPGTPFINGAMIRADDDLYIEGTLSPAEPVWGRDAANNYVHFDGVAWTVGTLGGEREIAIERIDPRFPNDDTWAACGPNAAHFDGAVVRPLGVPLPATDSCQFGHANGRYSMIYKARSAPSVTPEAYSCDGQTCTLLDVPGYTSSEFQRQEWDGKQWTNLEVVARVEQCVGPACGYGGGTNVGVVGTLEDGTQLFIGKPKADSASAAEPETLFVIRP